MTDSNYKMSILRTMKTGIILERELNTDEVYEVITNFQKEIEQLEEQIEICKDANTRCCNEYSAMRKDVLRYKEENEQLKQQIEELKSDLKIARMNANIDRMAKR